MIDKEYGVFIIDDEIVSLGINPQFDDFRTVKDLEINTAKGHKFIAGAFSDEIMRIWKDGSKYYGLFKIQAFDWNTTTEDFKINNGLLLDVILFK